MKKIVALGFIIMTMLTACHKASAPVAELPIEVDIPSPQQVMESYLKQDPDELEVDLSVEEENEDVSIDK